MESSQPPKVLTIAGSDSGGAAGLQADLKTFTALGVYGMSAVTMVTAQSSVQVAALHPVPPAIVAAQMETVLDDYGAAAIKTGFLGSVELVTCVAKTLARYRKAQPVPVVVDPVLVNHRGEAMFGDDVTEAYRQHLLPGCTLVTPNLREAALLCGKALDSWIDTTQAAGRLCQMGASAVLITGARREGQYGDALFDGKTMTFLPQEHLETHHTHGSGDTLSAAVAAFLAQELGLGDAVRRAQTFTAEAIRGALNWRMGGGHGPLNHLLHARSVP